MYLQEIVVSPDIFAKIVRAFSPEHEEDVDMESYKKNLDLKKIIFDNDQNNDSYIFNELKKAIDGGSDLAKHKIDSILKKFTLVKGNLEFRNVPVNKTFPTTELNNRILNLSLLTDSKIINSEDKNISLLRLKNDKLAEIEVLNFSEFIDPPYVSKIYSSRKTIRINRRETFRFEEYFRPYLIDTTFLSITDRYIRDSIALANLIKLMRLCKNLKGLK